MHRLDHLDPPVLKSTRLVPVAWVMCVVATVAVVAVGFSQGGASQAWTAVLAGLMLPLWLAVGSLFFIAAHSIGGAKWVAPYLRVMEGVGAGLPLSVLAFTAIGVFGIPYVYEWSHDNPLRDSLFRDPHGGKAWWMSEMRWLVTGVAILCLFVMLQRALAVRPRTDAAEQMRHVRWSVVTLVLLVPTFTLLSWDLLLSLQVQFTSAIFGVYCLVSAVHAFLGAVALIVVWLGRSSLAQVSRPHLNKDIGTWIVAWSCIIAYISLAQYIIISFANIDEESSFFLMSMQHGYSQLYVADVVLRCLVPFALLMSQRLRTNPTAMTIAGIGILLGTWLEIHWLIAPACSRNEFHGPFGLEALVAIGFLSGALLLAIRSWKRDGLVQVADDRILPAINAEHLQ